MSISVAYFTSRLTPHWEWFCDSLVNQMREHPYIDLHVIFVDGHAWNCNAAAAYKSAAEINVLDPSIISPERREELKDAVRGRFSYHHLPPKPNVWQGPFRLTQKDWFAASNARNTALIAATGNYFVGVDDLTVLMPGWLSNVLHAADNGYCVCGAYRKDVEMVVESGYLLSSKEHSRDSRWDAGQSSGIVPAAGSWLFGCSFGVPLELALKVNGFDEICDGQSAEDYDFGVRVGRAGGQFFYNRNMLTVESEEGHHGPDATLARQSKLVTPDRLPSRYDKDPMSDHVLLNRLLDEDRIHTLASPDIRRLRSRFFSNGTMPIPREPAIDWRDGTPLSSY